MPPPISICIAAKNEQAKIRAALESARRCAWCKELAVFDSGSTDRTVSIAGELADRVQPLQWTSYADSKRRMVEAAGHDWVFILDADEQISPDLADQIERLADQAFAEHPIITMPRHNYLLGRHVRAWDPDRQSRLIDRRRVRWPQRAVHDQRIATEGQPLHLPGHLDHNRGFDDFGDYFDGPRYQQRIDAMARELFDQGKRAGYGDLMLRPAAAFVKMYLLKRGFTQGSFGLLIAQKAAVFTQLKYARLWHLQQGSNDEPSP